jgi:hypothetical protein
VCVSHHHDTELGRSWRHALAALKVRRHRLDRTAAQCPYFRGWPSTYNSHLNQQVDLARCLEIPKPTMAIGGTDAMETEDTSVNDALRERLDEGKALKSLKPAEAEAIFKALVATGELSTPRAARIMCSGFASNLRCGFGRRLCSRGDSAAMCRWAL